MIFRFKCFSCSRTFGLFPPFLIPRRGAALDVQEQVLRELDEGQPLRAVAENLGQRTEAYSEKTLWRWKRTWDRWRASLEPAFWTQALARFPHLRLPVGAGKPQTGWGWLFALWESIRSGLAADPVAGCLQWLLHLARSRALAV